MSADKLATKLKAAEEKAETYGKHIKATADKAAALEKDATESQKKASVSFKDPFYRVSVLFLHNT